MISVFEQGFRGGLILSIIAFSVVFLVLGGLTLIIVAIKLVGGVEGKKKDAIPPSGGETTPVETVSPPPAEEVLYGEATQGEGSDINEEEVAAMTAAVAAFGAAPFTVKSIKAITPPKISLWRKASFYESLEGME